MLNLILHFNTVIIIVYNIIYYYCKSMNNNLNLINSLFMYIRNHEWTKFKNTIKENKSVDLNFRQNGKYLITYAINYNKIDIVKFLFENGSKYDIIDDNGRSIIYIPIKHKYTELIDIILEYSQKQIGLDIVNIRDNNNNIPIHYAIKYNDTQTVIKLIKLNSNLLLYDNKGYNSLHIAIKMNNYNIIKHIINNISNINNKTKNGETSLHISINYNYTQTILLLLHNKADPNILDNINNFTSLHYAVGWNNVYIVKKLLEYKADPSIQDIYGNIPLVYSIKENYMQIFDILINTNINVNQWNVDGRIVLHEILYNYTPKTKYFIDKVIPLSNLLIQDKDGNSCLHLLIIHNIWEDYIDILKKKKINIFSKNSNNKTVIDYIYPHDIHDVIKLHKYNKFLDIVVESYLFQLKKEKKWKTELDKICSREFSKLTVDERKKLDNIKNNKDMIIKCKKLIYNKLLDNIKLYLNNKCTFCSYSYPLKYDTCNIKLSEYTMIDVCTFTGSLLDILFGMIHIIQTHKNVCGSLDINIKPNDTLCDFYKSLGLNMNGNCRFLNFEMVWVEFKLYTVHNYNEIFNRCVKSDTRFIIIPLGIELSNGSHSNYLLYDKSIKEIERFEPHGGTTPVGFNYNSELLDSILTRYFKNIDKDIKYISPIEYIPKIGFQIMESYETEKTRIGDPKGFCALWCIWYVEHRVTYYDLDRKTLIKELFKTISTDSISYKNMIRNYSRNIIQQRDIILKEIDIDINDWLNNNYTNNQLDNIITLISKKINKIR